MKMSKLFSLLVIGFLSFYSTAQDCIYIGNISQSTLGQGITGPGVNSNTGGLDFDIDVSNTNLVDEQSYAKVIHLGSIDYALECRNLGGEIVLTTDEIPMYFNEHVTMSTAFEENGEFEEDDYIEVYYRLDGGEEIMFDAGRVTGDFNDASFSKRINVEEVEFIQIVIRLKNDDVDERHRMTKLSVTPADYPSILGFSSPNSEVNEPTSGETNHLVEFYRHAYFIRSSGDLGNHQVTITDNLTGSATPGVDYNFTPQNFSLNSSDGCNALKNAEVAILADSDDDETPETIDLLMTVSSPSPSFHQTRTTLHTITINQSTALPLEVAHFSAQAINEKQIDIQ